MNVSALIAAVPISRAWVELGGDSPRRGRARAFYRDGDNPGAVSLNDDKGCWHDFVTGQGGGILDLIQHVRGCDRIGAVRWLSDFTGVPLDDQPLTEVERRQYARARHEASDLIAWKDRILEALKSERRRWWRIHHGARMPRRPPVLTGPIKREPSRQ